MCPPNPGKAHHLLLEQRAHLCSLRLLAWACLQKCPFPCAPSPFCCFWHHLSFAKPQLGARFTLPRAPENSPGVEVLTQPHSKHCKWHWELWDLPAICG